MIHQTCSIQFLSTCNKHLTLDINSIKNSPKFINDALTVNPPHFAVANGFLSTRITLSPRRNILEMYRSLLTGFDFFLPLPAFGVSVHISFTFSSTMLQCLSNALTLPSSFLLFLQLISTCVLFLTDCVRTDNGPVLNSSSSRLANSSGVSSLLGLGCKAMI